MKASITLLLFLNAKAIAQRSEGHGGLVSGEGGGANSLYGTYIAALVFYILFLAFCLGSAIFIIKRPRGQYPRQTPFMALLLTTLISFIISYSLGIYVILVASPGIQTDYSTLQGSSTPGDFFLNFGHMSFFAGICLVLDWRAQHPSYIGTSSPTRIIPSIIRIASPVLLFSMVVFTIIRLGIEGSGQSDLYRQAGYCFNETCYEGGLYAMNWPATYAARAMYHLYVASYVLLTIVIVTTTLSIWNGRSVKAESELTEFDKRVTSRILHTICPAISIAALYLVIDDIVFYVEQTFLRSTSEILVVTSAVIYTLAFGIAIFRGIKLGS